MKSDCVFIPLFVLFDASISFSNTCGSLALAKFVSEKGVAEFTSVCNGPYCIIMEQNDETNKILKIGAGQGNIPGRNEFGYLRNEFDSSLLNYIVMPFTVSVL